MRRSYSAAGTFSLSLSRLDIEKPPGDIHRWRRTNLVVTGLWLLAFVQSPVWDVRENHRRDEEENRQSQERDQQSQLASGLRACLQSLQD